MTRRPQEHIVLIVAAVTREQADADILTAEDVGELLGICARQIRRYAAAGRLPVYRRFRGGYLFLRQEVAGFRPRPRGRPVLDTTV